MKIAIIFLGLLLSITNFVSAEQLKAKVEAVPKVYSVTSNTQANLASTHYPVFENYSGEQACGETLAGLSGTRKTTPTFTPISEMVLEGAIPDAYRQHGSAMIAWTIRIEGSDPEPETIWASGGGGLCGVFHGSVDQVFKGGLVQTQAYISTDGVNFTALGVPSTMTMPDGGSTTTTVTSDPTHSGSYVLKAEYFPAKSLPEKIWVKIYWKNDTGLNIFSRAKYRSLMAVLLPTEK